MSENNNQVKIFFSWQSDSPPKTNRYFIEDCLKKAAKEITKEITKEIPIIFTIDRDTKDVGGMPGIVDTIFQKIRSCDIFVWDATIIYTSPKYAPNPNVLLELGYAFALVGEGRIIGIINKSNGINADKLPFDLMHRRWPIQYDLDCNDPNFSETKKEQKKHLIKNLKEALKTALKEPKKGIIQSDIDFYIANNLWKVINSDWLMNWLSYKKQNIQYELSKYLDTLEKYKFFSLKPENQFVNENLQSSHTLFLKGIENYLLTSATEMVPTNSNDNVFVISVKKLDWFEEYDEQYEKQVKRLSDAIKQIEDSWKSYVHELRLIYPEITHNY